MFDFFFRNCLWFEHTTFSHKIWTFCSNVTVFFSYSLNSVTIKTLIPYTSDFINSDPPSCCNYLCFSVNLSGFLSPFAVTSSKPGGNGTNRIQTTREVEAGNVYLSHIFTQSVLGTDETDDNKTKRIIKIIITITAVRIIVLISLCFFRIFTPCLFHLFRLHLV